jgi:biotin carboxyl carrier protein
MINSKINSNNYSIEFDAKNKFKGKINNDSFNFVIESENNDNYRIVKDGVEYDIDIISVNTETKSIQTLINGKSFEITLEDEFDAIVNKLGFKNKAKNTEKIVKAHMPGLIINIHVKNGDTVLKGQKILTLEAMKMENIIKATDTITIKEVKVKKGNTVEKNDILFDII